MKKLWLQFVSWFNRKAKNFSIRLVKWTGKSKQYVHPKHLVGEEFHFWFTPHLKPSDIVLDLGCGGGAHALAAAPIVTRVVGIDYNEKNLKIARDRARDEKIQNAKFEQGNLEGVFPIPDQTFTAVLALDILEHLNSREQFLNEARRVLRAGGLLFLSVPNRDTQWKRSLAREGLFYYSDLDHKYEYEKNEIEQILKQHHFEILFFDTTVYDTPLVGLIDMLGGISLTLYGRLSKWKRSQAVKHPEEATGFRIIAKKL